MIKEYTTGTELVEDNREFLESDKYLAVFFFLDAPLLTVTDSMNYAFRSTQGDKTLLAMKVEPYNLMFFGDEECVPEMAECLINGGYEVKSFMCAEKTGNAMCRELNERYDMRGYESLAMEFMEAREITSPSCDEVTSAEEGDAAEICELTKRFVADCGLDDEVDPEAVKKNVSSFRIIREDGKIVSLARISPSAGDDLRITNVYTRDEYRSKGYARKVVNAVKNEILGSGHVATLNVDRRNPVSSHLYRSIGFVPVFAQGVYKMNDYDFISLRERPDLIDEAASWFSGKWKVPFEAYHECMEAYLKRETELGWYLCLDGDLIAGGLGVIENDFHDRKDLAPNVCAVYTEKAYRFRGIAGTLLGLAVDDLRAHGISPVYLVTDHDSFYERYGWEFFCMVNCDGEDGQSRLYIHR